MKLNNKSFVFVLACLISCQSGDKTDIKLKQISQNSLVNYESVIIIPGEGCNGCISDAANFVKTNIETLKKTLIIFTNIKDNKLLRLKIGNDIFRYSNVKIDSLNLINETKLASLYPQLAQIKNGNVYKYENFNKESFK